MRIKVLGQRDKNGSLLDEDLSLHSVPNSSNNSRNHRIRWLFLPPPDLIRYRKTLVPHSPSRGSVFSMNSPVAVSTMAIVCCLACRSHPTILISASFVPSFLVGYRKVYSGRHEADVAMSSPTEVCKSGLGSGAISVLARNTDRWGRP